MKKKSMLPGVQDDVQTPEYLAKEAPCVPMVQADAQAIVERIEEVLQVSPEYLAKAEAIHVSLVPVITTRVDITIIPKR